MTNYFMYLSQTQISLTNDPLKVSINKFSSIKKTTSFAGRQDLFPFRK